MDLAVIHPVRAAAAAAATLKRIVCSGFVVAAVLAPAPSWSHGASFGAWRKRLEAKTGSGGLLEDLEQDGFGDRRRLMCFDRLDPAFRWWFLRLTTPFG